jgi:hypothetical protein
LAGGLDDVALVLDLLLVLGLHARREHQQHREGHDVAGGRCGAAEPAPTDIDRAIASLSSPSMLWWPK